MNGRSRVGGQVRSRVGAVAAGRLRWREDRLAAEEPLEIRLAPAGGPLAAVPLSVTMRTPGHDFELVTGLLFAEGIAGGRDDIARIGYCVDPTLTAAQRYNVVTVELRDTRQLEAAFGGRRFAANSACGVCGAASLDHLERRGLASLAPGPRLDHATLVALPAHLRQAQNLFDRTGGLHGAGLFTMEGRLLAAREDIGRHNAVDKLVGWALLEDRLPLSAAVLVVSGRAGFEIAQKCVGAGIPILAAVSAPSSLAVDLARRFGLTLIGFLRESRYNIYHGAERIVLPAGDGDSERTGEPS